MNDGPNRPMQNTTTTVRFTIIGDVKARAFPPWIERHARKLGVRDLTINCNDRGLDVTGTGAPEMLESLAIACSLGPADVLVDAIDGLPTTWQIEA